MGEEQVFKTARDYLQQVWYAENRAKDCYKQIRNLRSTLYTFGLSKNNIDSDPVLSSPDPDRLASLVAEIDAEERTLIKEIEGLMRMRRKIRREISQLPTRKYQEILRKRYIMMEGNRQIADDLGYGNIRNYYRARRQAHLEFERIFPEKFTKKTGDDH